MTLSSTHLSDHPAARFGAMLVLGLLAALAFGSCMANAATPGWKVLAVTGPTNLAPTASEVQEIGVDAEGGTFVVTFPGTGRSTLPIPFDAGAGRLESELDQILPAGATVEVSGGAGDPGATHPYFVRFAGDLAGSDVPELTATVGTPPLVGAGAGVAVSTATQGGGPGTGEVLVYATNVGGVATVTPVSVSISLPSGITTGMGAGGGGWTCTPAGAGQTTLGCTTSEQVEPSQNAAPLRVPVVVGPSALSGTTAEIAVSGGGALSGATFSEPVTISAIPAKGGVEAFWAGAFDSDGNLYTQAGGHPFSAETGFLLSTILAPSGIVVPAGDLREADVELPTGFIGNPLATSRCPVPNEVGCFDEAIVGDGRPILQTFGDGSGAAAVYNDTPANGFPADFTFSYLGVQTGALGVLRSDSDYGVTASVPAVSQVYKIYGSFFAFWGQPGDPLHDGQRCSQGLGCGPNPSVQNTAFLTNPTDCAAEALSPPTTGLVVNSWQQPTLLGSASYPSPPVTGCDALAGHFDPTFAFHPESHQAAAPSPFTADLHIPQEGLTEPEGLAAPDLKKAVVTLPRGVDVNPASANGLEACSEGQMGLTTTTGAAPNPIRFDKSEPSCPEASKLGTVEAKSPLLEETLGGTIYLAAQEENPFHSLLALYLVIDSPKNGILVKLPGEVKSDANTGQLTATFDNNPQLPVEDLKLNFRGGGPRSPLATPAVCGTYTTHGELTPWSAPESGPPARTEDSFQVTGGPGGGACATSEGALPFSPSFEAGTTSTQAGAYAPLVIKIGRKDGEQELTHLDFTLPPGLTGRLAGIPYCSDAAIAEAGGKSGKAEQASPSCPAASEVGTVDTSAGVGGEPIHVGGHVYLAGPYEGAPLSTVVITPAVAGPFDLGDVVIRAALFVNPETAQITAKSDEIPHILRGIPLQLRSVELKITRQGFILNPTSCNPMTVTSGLAGLNGGGASPSSRFQVGGCSALKFKPKLKLSLKGGTRRAKFPALKAVLTQPAGQANVRYVQALLPHSEFLEQGHIGTICTRVQFNAVPRACPTKSVYGKAKAWSPLLEAPLEGPVYLRSNGGERELPDLVAALKGPASQPIEIDLVGYIDSKHARIRNTFALVPDAPVSRFVLEMQGGKKGLLVNSTNLCKLGKAKKQATVRVLGHNNKRADQFPLVQNQCSAPGPKSAKKNTSKRLGTSHR